MASSRKRQKSAGSDAVKVSEYKPKEFKSFFQEGPGKWIHWIEGKRGKESPSIIYFDNTGHLEVYNVNSDGLQRGADWVKRKSNGKKITAQVLLLSSIAKPQLQAKRQCVYDLGIAVNQALLNTMVYMPDVQSCEQIGQKLGEYDRFDGVQVELENYPKFSLERFTQFPPAATLSPVWMHWTAQPTHYLYKDSAGALEIYGTDDASPYNQGVYVKIPPFLLGQKDKLHVARSRLYKLTGNLQATQAQLEQMVALIDGSATNQLNIKKWGDAFYHSMFLKSEQQKENSVPEMEFFNNQDFAQFFRAAEGPWTRFMHVKGVGMIYYDDRGNLELFAKGYDNLKNLQQLIDRASRIKPTALVNTSIDVEGVQFAHRRLCLHKLNIPPTPQVLTSLVHIPDIQQCDNLQQLLQDYDAYNDVRVEIFNPAFLNLDEFENWRPAIDSPVWMAWASQPGVLYYKDSDDNLEVYHAKENAGPRHQHALYVQIPFFLLEKTDDTKLLVARSRLYQQTNELYATQDQLNDMVKRIEKHKARTPDWSSLKQWGDSLYQKTAQSQSRGPMVWTYKTVPGKTPMKPKFYFNPRPLRKGMSTMGILYNEFSKLTTGNS
jgi:hypothetical protein